ncbi:MAG: DUF1987 domain-containing protein [Cyclobacteriaceae bacterium]
MEPLRTAETNETPKVNLDKAAGIFQIEGRSLTETPSEFYKPAIQWLKGYAKAPNPETTVTFNFEYLNIESSKSILDLLNILEEIPGARVTWYFGAQAEDMEEIGEELAELVNIPFSFQAKT